MNSFKTYKINDVEFDENSKIKYGSSSSVRKAILLKQSQPVAVKIYKFKNTDNFKNELKILSVLNHENLLSLIGVYENDKDSLITDWCSGPNLYEFLNSKCDECYYKTSMYDLMDMGLQISNGMTHLHSMNILHRDLKSKNVFLTQINQKWKVKIGDFNLAIYLNDEQSQAFQQKCEGSYYWMAPEVLNKNFNDKQIDNPYTFKSDVYSFGIIMYELVTGNLPFKDLDPMVMVLKVGRRSIKLEPNASEDSPKEAVELMMKCADFDRDARPEFSEISHKLTEIKNKSPKQVNRKNSN